MKKSLKAATVTMAASLCMVSGILCGAQTFAHASSVSVEDMKDYLASINIPKVYLEAASEEQIEQKYQLYYGNDIIVENEISYLNEGGEDTAMTLGTISTSDMKFEITKVTICSSNAEGVRHIKRLCFTITYEWKKLPFFKKTDAIIANWNPSVFTYLEDSFSAGDIRILDVGTIITKDKVIHETKQPGELTQGGIGYEMALNTFETQDEMISLSGISGYADFTLVPAKNPMLLSDSNMNGHYTTSIDAQYRHTRNLFLSSVGLSVSGLSVTFSSSFATDTIADATMVYYKY